jgi:hypothetical protein
MNPVALASAIAMRLAEIIPSRGDGVTVQVPYGQTMQLARFATAHLKAGRLVCITREFSPEVNGQCRVQLSGRVLKPRLPETTIIDPPDEKPKQPNEGEP